MRPQACALRLPFRYSRYMSSAEKIEVTHRDISLRALNNVSRKSRIKYEGDGSASSSRQHSRIGNLNTVQNRILDIIMEELHPKN